jgi:hypothetical protein
LKYPINSLNAELNAIGRLLVLLGAHLIFHVSGVRVHATLNSAFSFLRIVRLFCEMLKILMPAQIVLFGKQVSSAVGPSIDIDIDIDIAYR